MHVAIVGCSHGEVDKIYEVIEEIEKKRSIKVKLVLCCGDFQSVRNMTDLRCMACPIKYQAMHDFYRYYSGEKKAPIPTLFIGGNHEASNFLQELPYGGWVAPNIYFCGNSTMLKFGSLRIAGVSGIYKGHDYLKGRYETPPYDNSTMRSVYHYRNLDIFRLKQIESRVDIMLSHDWPKGIHEYGNTNRLLRLKPFFRSEIEKNELGSRPLFELLTKIQPRHWFSAHLHVIFPAIVIHPNQNEADNKLNQSATTTTTAPDPDPPTVEVADSTKVEVEEIDAKDNGASTRTSSHPPGNPPTPASPPPITTPPESRQNSTYFLALDKVLPARPFLQILDIPADGDGNEDPVLSYDPEWLAILKSTKELMLAKNALCYMPNERYPKRFNYTPTTEELEEINEIFQGKFEVPQNFSRTAPIYVDGEKPGRAFPIENPQTTEFCKKVGLEDPLRLLQSSRGAGGGWEESLESHSLNITLNENSYSQISMNPDEISLEEDDGAEGEDAPNDDDMDTSQGRKPLINISDLVESITGRSGRLQAKAKLSLPPPKHAVIEGDPDPDDSTPVTHVKGGEELEEAVEVEAQNDEDAKKKSEEAKRKELEILRSVLGPGYGLELESESEPEPGPTGSESEGSLGLKLKEGESFQMDTGLSFVLDRKGSTSTPKTTSATASHDGATGSGSGFGSGSGSGSGSGVKRRRNEMIYQQLEEEEQ